MNTKYTGPIKEVEVVEKIVISQEQAKAIECVKSDTYWNFEIFLNSHAKNKKSEDDLGESWNGEYYPLNKLSVGELAKAFYIGYEIEPEQPKFEAGDKVVYGKEIVTLVERDYRHDCYGTYGRAWKFKEFAGWLGEKQFHKATPEEIYWLEELGREKVGDFRDGDIYVKENDDCYLVGSDVFAERALDWYEEDYNFGGLYPADSFRPFKKEPSHE